MHQDQRIGLALAVLLLGAAGAFFFRHDPKPAGSPPRLKSASELDARIAEKAISPYLQNSDDHEPARSGHRRSDPQAGANHSLPGFDTPDFLNLEDQSPAGTRITGGNQPASAIPFPDTGGDSPAGRDLAGGTGRSPAGERTHVVQRGETLSSIAAREMGSSNRFQELYEANRDQLSDANALKPGMTLRIPARVAARAGSLTPKVGESESRTAPPLPPETDAGDLPPLEGNPDQPARKKFESPRRLPLGVKGLGSQTSDAEAAPRTVRKLSQMPPKEASGQVAR